MNLLVDIGNSRLKWAQSMDGELFNHGSCDYDRENFPASLQSAMKSIDDPGQVLVANVGGEALAIALEDYCSSRWSITPVFAKVSEKLAGVHNGYKNTRELGIDRWLALVAAWQTYRRPLCVVDCGTALTIDVVDSNAVYSGGYIIPGIDLMINSLSRNTDQVKVAHSESMTLQPGLQTVDCVVHGVYTACVSAIRQVLQQSRQGWGEDVGLVLTGGAAESIGKHLDDDFNIEPWLVLQGLQLIPGDVS